MALKFQKTVLPIALMTMTGASTANGLKLSRARPFVMKIGATATLHNTNNYDSTTTRRSMSQSPPPSAPGSPSHSPSMVRNEQEHQHHQTVDVEEVVEQQHEHSAAVTIQKHMRLRGAKSRRASNTESTASTGKQGKRTTFADLFKIKNDILKGFRNFLCCVGAGLLVSLPIIALNVAGSENGTPNTQGEMA